jgi:3-oxoacyl-[acyl-carrier protein] reductase
MGSLDGKVIAITGGGRGIGRAAALLCAAEGASVVVNDLGTEVDGNGSSTDPARRVSEEIADAGGKATFTSGDAGSVEGAEGVIKTALDQFGALDGLVCASGIRRDRPIWSTSEADWNAAVPGMVRGYFLPAKYATILMRQQRSGKIVMLTSDAGLGAAGNSLLAAASEGIIGLARTVARDVGRYGVTCNSVSAQADTRLFDASVIAYDGGAAWAAPVDSAGLPAPAIDAWQDEGSPWAPENVAPLIAFLLTDASTEINGQHFGARGGDIFLYNYPSIERSIQTYGRRFTLDELDILGPRSIGFGVPQPAMR